MVTREWEIEGTLLHAERAAIIAALEYCDHSRSAAAARLRIRRSTLYRFMAAYEIESSKQIARASATPFTRCDNSKRDLSARERGRQDHSRPFVEADGSARASKITLVGGQPGLRIR